MKKIILHLAATLILSSCMTTKTYVGKYQEQTGKEYKYSKTKQIWILWGLIPVGRTHAPTPADGNCLVITRFNVTDAIISSLTGGIVITETIKIKAKK